MNRSDSLTSVPQDDVANVIARETGLNADQILPFVDCGDLLAELLHIAYQPTVRMIAAGTVTPDIAQAAHRAEMELTEALGTSPFSGDVVAVLNAIASPADVIYVANPNRVTGAHFSTSELAEMTAAVPDGLVVVDEHFVDFFGISATELTAKHLNLVILRSFTASFSINSSDAGYLVANPWLVEVIRKSCQGKPFSRTQHRLAERTLTSHEARESRLTEVRNESLRIVQELNTIGVQGRICATNFVLLRVADPTAVGNALATAGVTVSNLDGYPQLKNYLSYQVQSQISNDRMLNALRALPTDRLRLRGLDLRKIRLGQGVARTTRKPRKARREIVAGGSHLTQAEPVPEAVVGE